MINEPIHVSDAEFEKSVLQSDLPVVVDFWAPWCGPCRMVAPILEKLASEYAGKLIIAKVNTDENPDWASRYGVQGIPTMLFISDGKLVHRQVGALPEGILRDVVNEFLEVAQTASLN
jgi:thioredoxin 1